MEKTKTIGELIKDYVYKSNYNITDFAAAIAVTRNNVYKIFERNSIDIDLLARISKVLDHNFFEDLANDMDLANLVPESEEERIRQRAITQYLDVVPKIFRKKKIDAQFFMGHGAEFMEDEKLPDCLITPYCISFTYGTTYEEKFHLSDFPYFDFKHFKNEKGYTFSIMTNKLSGLQSCDVALVYRTEEEWNELIDFILETINREYNSITRVEIRRFQHC